MFVQTPQGNGSVSATVISLSTTTPNNHIPLRPIHCATTPERVTISTDAQAATRRMASEEPGPGQMHAILARKHIATLRRARPGIAIEVRWRPAHKGVPGNEKADEWAKLAAESRTHTVWNGYRLERDQCYSPDPLRTSSERSLRRSGVKLVAGLQAESPPRSTGCHVSSGRTRQRLAALRCLPLGSTS